MKLCLICFSNNIIRHEQKESMTVGLNNGSIKEFDLMCDLFQNFPACGKYGFGLDPDR